MTTPFSVPDDGSLNPGTAACPAGTNVTGGGANIADTTNGVIEASYPAGSTGWTGVFQDFGGTGTPTTGTVYAICAPAASTAP